MFLLTNIGILLILTDMKLKFIKNIVAVVLKSKVYNFESECRGR